MLQLQKASAGSGKTYALTRTYIRLFLCEQQEDGTYRLRKPIELRNAHSHLLAITFTNKATNEMKQRIVQSLADLAAWQGAGKMPAYLEDFIRETGERAEDICRVAGVALSVLLNSYTDFQVSTIDSFFQTILRTFAYKTDLSDNYQVELDNEYLAKTGIDMTLSQVKDRKNNEELKYWISQLMEEKVNSGTRWNIFNQNSAPYQELTAFIRQMDDENFKKILPELEEYLDSAGDLRKEFEAFRKALAAECERLLNALKSEVEQHRRKIDAAGGSDFLVRYYVSALDKILAATPDKLPKLNTRYGSLHKPIFKAKSEAKLGSGFCTEAGNEADAIFDGFEKLEGFKTLSEILTEKLHYIGLYRSVARNLQQFREENNLVKLSDTNTILSRIIGDDETPFIYERIGYYIRHYMIDEFQDTSEMQWDILEPLLSQSLAYDYDNLIIGDPKQSIYRFRNADSSLITDKVPEQMGERARLCGNTPEENTNRRSAGEIVRFNNSFFRHLARTLTERRQGLGFDFSKLYASAPQIPFNDNIPGYVEIRIRDGKPEAEDDENADDPFAWVPELIAELLERGYSQKDIAILVRKNVQGKSIIESLIRFNRCGGVGGRPIRFVSEESLLIARAESVRIITSVLSMIARGAQERKRSEDDYPEPIPVDEFNCNFNLYRAAHHDLSAGEVMELYLSEESHADTISGMLASMQSVALPALVENIIADFVPEHYRTSEAPFIAAFQDKVLDYCEGYPSDITSFLNWWKGAAEKASISTPEGTDAVNIMTVHKSKGLEFPCVIMPTDGFNFDPSKHPETVWVHPELPEGFAPGVKIPKVLPVRTISRLAGTPYEEHYLRYVDRNHSDLINLIYVAFTRASRELYVCGYAPAAKKGTFILASELEELCDNFPTGGDPQLDIKPELLHCEPGLLTYGLKPDVKKDASDSSDVSDPYDKIKGYFVNTERAQLIYQEEDATQIDEEEDPDPRSFGNLMHEVMQEIATPDDLDRAILRARARGHISFRIEEKIRTEVMRALSHPVASQWFRPGLRVINERSLLSGGHRNQRPDRIVIDPEGNAAVIDYKFGDHTGVKRYTRQVTRYVDLLRRTGVARTVRGYVWYVRAARIDPAD